LVREHTLDQTCQEATDIALHSMRLRNLKRYEIQETHDARSPIVGVYYVMIIIITRHLFVVSPNTG